MVKNWNAVITKCQQNYHTHKIQLYLIADGIELFEALIKPLHDGSSSFARKTKSTKHMQVSHKQTESTNIFVTTLQNIIGQNKPKEDNIVVTLDNAK